MAHFDEFELSGHEVDTDVRDEADTSFSVDQVVYPVIPLEDPNYPSDGLGLQRAEFAKERAVSQYYADLKKMGYGEPESINYKNFQVAKDGSLNLLMGDKYERLTTLKGGRPLEEVIKKKKIQQALGVTRVALPVEATTKLQGVKKQTTDVENIPMQDLPQAATKVSQAIERTITDEELAKALRERGTFESYRDLVGVDKALQRIRGELTNKVAKLAEFDREIARRKHKIETAPNEEARKIQESKLKDLNADRRLMFEAALTDRDNIRSQFNRIRETIDRLLNEDTTLGERLRTLFREQGITIASILTALGMIIGVIVQAVTGHGASLPSPPSPPPDKPGMKEWVKQRLQDLGRLLGKLAEKAAAALPGIIGSIVSWLLSTAQKAVGWLAENLWALVVAIVGMVYLTAKDYMFTRRLAPPKKE